jgi:hypothetical protein
VVIAATAAIITGAVLVVQSLAGAGGCGDGSRVRLTVAADPAIAPAVREIADRWAETEQPAVDGRCVAVEVTAAATAEVASALATSAGGFIDVGPGPGSGSPANSAPPQAPTAPAAGVPAVWVPDSSYWLARLRAVSRAMFEPDPPSLASSPVVLAASPAGTQMLGVGPGDPVAPVALREPLLGALAAEQPLPVTLAEPRRDTAGLVGAGWLQQATVTAEAELPNLVATFRRLADAPPDPAGVLAQFGADPLLAPVSEQAVTVHNQTDPANPITAVPVAEAPSLDFPYAVLARQPRDLRTAATRLGSVLTGSAEVFVRHGFQPAGAGSAVGSGAEGSAPLPAPEQATGTLRIWTSATRDARVLSVVNVDASMNTPMVTADGDQVPRFLVFQATALAGIPLFTDGTDLGHWEYAVGLDGDQDWVEGVPVATLTPEHRQAVEQAVQSVRPVATDQAALFETLLAGYRTLQQNYDPTRSNTLIMWTDGGPSKAGGLTLAETLTELERMADVTRPIRVILLGLGPDADLAELTAIAEATGGGAFHLADPDEIALVFLRALLT